MLKIKSGKIQTEASLYVTNGKTEIQLYDTQDNIIDVNEGDVITIFTKQVTKKEVRNSLLFFPLHIISAIFRCVLLDVEKDYVEKKIEPYVVKCKYIVTKEDISNGIKIDIFPSKYKAFSEMIIDAKMKINGVEQDIEQIPNHWQGVKALNSFYMDMGWIVMAVNALGIYCIGFGIQHLMGSRGIISIAIGLVLLIGMWLAYVVKIVADKRVINRLTAILEDVDREK